ncbi:MAG: hypothetical protein H0X61_13465 [Acidimicrobiia bacterium]|jgi:F-type H+-transporting ATPase subunit b|nr:hypothetical protein [Acidimicrobiia bacterium]MBA3984524.1 hypothetical protein [Acidimicrobiia bacterium]MDQ3391812.1 hypothetical protein [Actinomycetota bacterium]
MSAAMMIASSIAAEDPSQSHHWLWPEGYEILYGGLASLIVFALLYWKAWPLVKRGLANRTERVQKELDDASTARTENEAESARIRQALGDIDAERQRLFAEADTQAEALLADGRRRLDAEVADLEAKAQADIAAAGDRSNDELRHEIVQLAGAAADRVAVESLDDATQQELIESFISRVGAGARP